VERRGIEVSSARRSEMGAEAIHPSAGALAHPPSCLCRDAKGSSSKSSAGKSAWAGRTRFGLPIVLCRERNTGKAAIRSARQQRRRSARLRLGQSRSPYVPLLAPILRGCHFFPGQTRFSKAERYFLRRRDAGWGAQICEQPVEGIVVFADVRF